MSVRGSLRTMSVEDIFDWLDRRSLSGTLSIEWSSTVRAFFIDGRHISWSNSNVPGEHLGQLMLRSGFLDEATLGGALETQAETGVPLGRILTMIGAVGEELVHQVLAEQAWEAAFDAMIWEDGDFAFEPGQPSGEIEFPLAIPLRACLEEGRWRKERMREIRALIPTDALVLGIISHTRLIGMEDDEPMQQEIALLTSAVEQGISVGEIIAYFQGRRFHVLHRLTQLMERRALAAVGQAASQSPGAVPTAVPTTVIDQVSDQVMAPVHIDEAADASAPTDLSVEQLQYQARARAEAGDREGAFALAVRAVELAPSRNDAQTLLQETERALFAVLSRELLTAFRVPKLLVPREDLVTLAMSESERYLASRVDGRWDLFSLMRMSRLREVEALITFKRLADRGIISL